MENNEENSNEKTLTAVYSYRSPSFTKEETAILIELIEKYKIFILNKSVSAIACQAKDTMWNKIERAFNTRSEVHERSTECLKTKWENLKRDARKLAKNILDSKNRSYNDLIEQVVTLISDNDNINTTELPPDSDNEGNDTPKIITRVTKRKNWDEQVDKISDDSMDAKEDGRINRSMNFSPQETKLLLECVKEEKKIIFSNECNKSSLKLKNRAWNRVTEAFNKKNMTQRPTKVLRTKFDNMKRLTKSSHFKDFVRDFRKKHQKLFNENENTIKLEPEIQGNGDTDDIHDDGFNDLTTSGDQFTTRLDTSPPDPLSTVLNGDTGSSWVEPESKEVEKLKTELLKYQIETAKLERERLLDSIQAEKSDRDSRAIETSLRLRTARLETVAAELRLPPAHPALRYTPEEARAQLYVTSLQYQHT